MRILITGADGFVGRHLSAALANSGHELTLAVRKDKGQLNIAGNVKIVSVGDVGPRTDWAPALQGVECVINLVGRNHVLQESHSGGQQAFEDVNCHGASRLYELAQMAGVTRFLHFSTVHVCGTDTPGLTRFNDTSPACPFGDYAVSKYHGEQEILRLASGKPGSLVILRPPLIVGAGAKGNLDRLIRLLARPLPIPVKSLTNRRSLLSIENLVSAVLTVLARWNKEAHSGTYLLGDDETVSTCEIARCIKIGISGQAWLMPLSPALLEFTLSLIGKRKTALQLTGSLEIDSLGFYKAFGWRPEVKTRDSLIGMGKYHFRT